MENKNVVQIIDNYTNQLISKYPNKTPEEWTEYFNSLETKFNSFKTDSSPYKIIMDLALIPDHINMSKDEFIEWFCSLGIKIVKNEDLTKAYQEYTTHETDKDPTRFSEVFKVGKNLSNEDEGAE